MFGGENNIMRNRRGSMAMRKINARLGNGSEHSEMI